MKVLMISTDRLVFDERSAVRERMRDYGTLFDELSVIVPTSHTSPFRETKIAHNVTLYPTRSRGKVSMFFHLYTKGATLLRSGQNVVITAQDPFFLGFIAYVLSRRFHVPFQLQVHVDFLSPHFQASVRRRIEQRLARFLLPRAECVRVVSRRIAESVLRHGFVAERKLVILPVFVDRTKMYGSVRKTNGKLRVLMYSRLEPEKDISLGIRAFGELLKTNPEAKMVIAGSGNEREGLGLLVKLLGIQENVSFAGWQDSEKIRSLLAGADIFLNTSRYEGYGRTLVEAALLGRAIVTTDVGIVGDVLSEREARICDVGDGVCVAAALAELAGDSGLRKTLGMAAEKKAGMKVFAERRAYLRAFKDSFVLCKKEL